MNNFVVETFVETFFEKIALVQQPVATGNIQQAIRYIIQIYALPGLPFRGSRRIQQP
jgi:hypothetical protein